MEKGNRFKDLSNIRFGKLIALYPIKEDGVKNYKWKCICDCGNSSISYSTNLISGTATSCGCIKNNVLGNNTRTHGLSNSRIFKIWVGIKKRCYNKNGKAYNLYGGRGIKVCDRWLDFNNFYEDMKIGYSDLLSLDRINTNGNYEKDNCRWADSETQNNNRRNNFLINNNGEIKTLSEWSKLSKVRPNTISNRIKSGWDVNKAIFLKTKSFSDLKSISKYLIV